MELQIFFIYTRIFLSLEENIALLFHPFFTHNVSAFSLPFRGLQVDKSVHKFWPGVWPLIEAIIYAHGQSNERN